MAKRSTSLWSLFLSPRVRAAASASPGLSPQCGQELIYFNSSLITWSCFAVKDISELGHSLIGTYPEWTKYLFTKGWYLFQHGRLYLPVRFFTLSCTIDLSLIGKTYGLLRRVFFLFLMRLLGGQIFSDFSIHAASSGLKAFYGRRERGSLATR